MKTFKCYTCQKILPEIVTLNDFLEKKYITNDIYNIIYAYVIEYNTEIEEIETPCNYHLIEITKCFQCQ